MEQWRDFMGLWMTSEREASRAAVSWIRSKSGVGTRELALGLAGERCVELGNIFMPEIGQSAAAAAAAELGVTVVTL